MKIIFKTVLALAILIIFSFSLAIRLSFPKNNLNISKNHENPINQNAVMDKDLEANYRSQLRTLIGQNIINIENGTIQKDALNSLFSGLLSLKVPGKYKDMHLELTLAVGRMSKYFENGDRNESLACQKTINKIYNENKWLE